MTRESAIWTSPSVERFAGAADPVAVMQEKCRELVDHALGEGLNGPPFDMFDFLRVLKIRAVPRHDVPDARIIPSDGKHKFIIEYNPNKVDGRIRFSIAHEIAHTLFPDCRDDIRNRETRPTGHLREIETLCNVGAAEILMPLDTIRQEIGLKSPSFGRIQEMQRQFRVSIEALLIRLVRLSRASIAAFCVSDVGRSNTGEDKLQLKVDYVIGSASWTKRIPHGRLVPASSRLNNISSFGWTEKSDGEDWSGDVPFEAMGLPPFPGSSTPRMVGLLTESCTETPSDAYREVVGDATLLRSEDDAAFLVQLVNDKAETWGGQGFSVQIRHRWPRAHEEYAKWAAQAGNLALGRVHFTQLAQRVHLASLVAQRGYGKSSTPRISYSALRTALARVAEEAERLGASVHMPQIGTGQAGGNWSVISHLVREAFLPRGISVTVYLRSLSPRQATLPLY